MSEDDPLAAAGAGPVRQPTDRVGTQPVTNTSPPGHFDAPVSLESLNATQREAWMALIEIVFGEDEGLG